MTAPAGWTLLTADRLLDGSGAGGLDDAAVLIEGATIRAIGRRSDVRPPDGAVATVHEYGDATILPGLVDGHTHLVGIGDGTRGDDLALQGEDLLLIRATVNARAMLQSGVTTIRENGSMGGIAFAVREAIRRGVTDGPRMVVAGRAVTITGGHLHWFGGEADGVDGVRHAVRQLVKEGADFIKIMASGGSTGSSHPYLPAFTPDELRAIVDEAHRHERLTAAHAVPSAAIEDCLDAGLDMIIHCSMTEATGAYVYSPALADRMAATGVWVNPTMHDIRAWLWYFRDEEAAGRPLTAADAATHDELRRLYDDKLDAVRRLHAAGVQLIAGSDSAWGRSRAGGGWLEIDALTDAGMSPAEAIAAGTTGSAAAIGVGDVAGRLEPGRPADLLVVAGDPLADLAALGDPLDVFQDGRRIARSETRSERMKVGLLLPQGYFNEFDGWRPGDAWDRILQIARLGERLGFDSLWTGEHVRAKWDPEGPIFDCVTIHTAVAAVVPRVDIGFCVVNSTFRNPAMTAKMASTLDTISGGRLVLGLGAGFKENEAAAFGQPYPELKERLAILSEHFEIVSRMTRRDEAPFTFEGTHARVQDVANAPRTGGGDHVRLLIGGHGRNVTFRLAARLCDEINIDAGVDEMADAIEAVRGRCDEIGRDPATLVLATGTNPAWPYPGLKTTGKQRMMKQEDLPAIMDYDFSAILPRAHELRRWVELGLDRVICGVPGLIDTDEGLYELIEDCRAAGVELEPAVASA